MDNSGLSKRGGGDWMNDASECLVVGGVSRKKETSPIAAASAAAPA